MNSRYLVNKYQSADDRINFNHITTFPITANRQLVRTTFATIYRNTMCEWVISIDSKPHNHLYQNGQRTHNQLATQVNLSAFDRREAHADIDLIEFRITVFHDTVEMEQLNYRITDIRTNYNHPDQSILGRRMYSTEKLCDFGGMLTMIATTPKYMGMKMELSTKICYKKMELIGVENVNLNEAEMVPKILDYTFGSLIDSSRHDFQLKTQSGQILKVSKMMLYAASDHFRRILTNRMTEYQTDAVHLCVLDTVVTYMLTGKYKPVPDLNTTLVQEIITLTAEFHVMNVRLLKNTLERRLYEQLCQKDDDFNLVVNMLLFSRELMFDNLFSSCVACITTQHFRQFIDSFTGQSHPLSQRINDRQGVFGPSLMMSVKRGYAASCDVTCYSKYVITDD